MAKHWYEVPAGSVARRQRAAHTASADNVHSEKGPKNAPETPLDYFSDEPITGPLQSGVPYHWLHPVSAEILHLAGQSSGPFTVAVFGTWGSGKTTVLRQFQNAIVHDIGKTDVSVPFRPAPPVIWFEPWRHEQEEHLILPLLAEMTAQLTTTREGLKRSALEASWCDDIVTTGTRLIGRAAKFAFRYGLKLAASTEPIAMALSAAGKVAGSDPPSLDAMAKQVLSTYADVRRERSEAYDMDIPESEMKAFKRDFSHLISIARKPYKTSKKKAAPPVCVFIDDLDRCSGDQVRRLFESMKNFLWEPGVIYFLALDRTQVTDAIAAPYIERIRGISDDIRDEAYVYASEYLEKFFLYPLEIGDALPAFEADVRTFRNRAFNNLKTAIRKRRRKGVTQAADWWDSKKEILDAGGLNLRRIKKQLRWLHLELIAHDPNDNNVDRGISARFAELIFAEAFPELWFRDFQGRPAEQRATAYARVLAAANAASFSQIIDGGIGIIHLIENSREVAEGRPAKHHLSDMDEETSANIEPVARTYVGKVIYDALKVKDFTSIDQLATLAGPATGIHQRPRLAGKTNRSS